MNHPSSIPADQFRPMLDTSTDDGKIAVYTRWIKTKEKPWVKARKLSHDEWDQIYPRWNWTECDYNYPAEPKRTLVPWAKDTVPREAWVRNNLGSMEFRITSVYDTGFGTDESYIDYNEATTTHEHSIDGGRTWHPCGTWKEEV